MALHLFFSKIHHSIDTFTDRLGQLVAVFSVIVVLLMASIVVLRYGFNLGFIAMQELTLYLHASVFLLGAGYTLKNDGHVRVDIFYAHFSILKKAWVNLLGTLLLLLPVCIFILVISWPFVLDSWAIFERSNESGGLPFVYILKSLIPLFSILLILQAIAEILKALLVILDSNSGNGSLRSDDISALSSHQLAAKNKVTTNCQEDK